MSVKALVSRLIETNPATRQWAESRRLRRRQRDWSTTHAARFGRTRISIHTNIGLGDTMIARQVCAEFLKYCELHGDPRLGHIAITAGAWPLAFRVPEGDHNVYWWWSMNGQDDWLDVYLNGINAKPHVVACLSSWCCEQVRAAGVRPLYLPLAAGEAFQSLGTGRNGIGFAGSRGHKDLPQVGCVIGPFSDRTDFEWVANLSRPEDLSAFYNRKSIVLGMTEIYQERAGMVNNRVFEVLATGTPFLIHTHRAIEEVLGHEFPYQTSSLEKTLQLANMILSDLPKHLDIFERYRKALEEKHRYKHRLSTLLQFLSTRG